MVLTNSKAFGKKLQQVVKGSDLGGVSGVIGVSADSRATTSKNWPQAGTAARPVNPRAFINPDPSSPPHLMSRGGMRVPEP